MTMKERMVKGLLYRADDEIKAEFIRARRLQRLFNNTTEEDFEYRKQLLKELLGYCGENIYIEPNFRCDYGSNITVGNNFYANFDCIILDVCPVTIGENVMFGPRVSLYTPLHPIDAEARASMAEYAKPIKIGDNVWLGGGVTVNGGVEIGNGTIIGSGSVVTKSVSEGVIAAGNPCRVIREITQDDKNYWEEQIKEFEDYLKS